MNQFESIKEYFSEIETDVGIEKQQAISELVVNENIPRKKVEKSVQELIAAGFLQDDSSILRINPAAQQGRHNGKLGRPIGTGGSYVSIKDRIIPQLNARIEELEDFIRTLQNKLQELQEQQVLLKQDYDAKSEELNLMKNKYGYQSI